MISSSGAIRCSAQLPCSADAALAALAAAALFEGAATALWQGAVAALLQGAAAACMSVITIGLPLPLPVLLQPLPWLPLPLLVWLGEAAECTGRSEQRISCMIQGMTQD
jgi:hypothetical protein